MCVKINHANYKVNTITNMIVYNGYNNSSKHFKYLFISIIIIPYNNNNNNNNKSIIEKRMRHFIIWILKIIRFSQYNITVYFIKKYKYETKKFVQFHNIHLLKQQIRVYNKSYSSLLIKRII